MVTIFTPTYNREKTLLRLYNSLLNQDFRDFEWLVVDDGSTDNTKEIINKFKDENKICIDYYKVENGGKQKALNFAVNKAKGDCFICIDSDDYLVENILAKVDKLFTSIKKDDKIAGIGFLVKKHGTEEIIGTKFPTDNMIETYTDIYYKFKVKGDKQLIYKTEVLKEFPFPLIEEERFIPEALVFNRISKKYKMLFVNLALTYAEYRKDGYSANYFNLVKKNPKGNMLYYKELYSVEPSLYNVAAYDLFGIYSKTKFREIVNNHPSKIKAIIMYLPSWIKYLQKK